MCIIVSDSAALLQLRLQRGVAAHTVFAGFNRQQARCLFQRHRSCSSKRRQIDAWDVQSCLPNFVLLLYPFFARRSV